MSIEWSGDAWDTQQKSMLLCFSGSLQSEPCRVWYGYGAGGPGIHSIRPVGDVHPGFFENWRLPLGIPIRSNPPSMASSSP